MSCLLVSWQPYLIICEIKRKKRQRRTSMAKITEELIRKKSEHNEMCIGSLEEISLHQEGIERLEHLQNWCKELKILLLHNNLISKIENLGKLKKLEYINFSQNNIEKIENLEGCESLNKLDFTLNFIGDLTSLESLKTNVHLKNLYLVGNPCTEYEGYRSYVVATLPQLQTLDGEEISPSERIRALQCYGITRADIIKQQQSYLVFRAKQKNKNKWRVDKWNEGNILCTKTPVVDHEQASEYWNEVSEHCPETRYDLTQRTRLNQDLKPGSDFGKSNTVLKPPPKLFNTEGRPLNVNQAKIPFHLTEDFVENGYKLDLAVYKHLDSSLLEVDVQPFYVRATIKGKIFQVTLMEEVDPDSSNARRSQTTGHLLVTMPWVKPFMRFSQAKRAELDVFPAQKSLQKSDKSGPTRTEREFLEVGVEFDLKKMLTLDKKYTRANVKKDLIDDPNVPPLI